MVSGCGINVRRNIDISGSISYESALHLTVNLSTFSYHHSRKGNMASDAFNRFVGITKRLRKDCPWDREQTHRSIRHSLIEEAYEVVDAIDHDASDELRKELGDLLLHVVFHANIAEEKGEFTLEDVIDGITEKLIFRHPHVFGDAKVENAEHVKRNWEKLKLEEGRTSLMDGVPNELPALLRAHRLQEKASKVGFDWEKKEDVWKKVEEELHEFQRATGRGVSEEIDGEFGDLLFALVNYARTIGLDAENALRGTIRKFVRRFQYIEQRLGERGRDIRSSTLEEMDALWEEAKGRG